MWLQINGHLRVICLALVLGIFVSGCGFQLKGAARLPASMTPLQLTANDDKSALYESLEETLEQRGVLVGTSKAPAAQLHLVSDALERSTLTLFPNGQVAQHELTYRVSYQLVRDEQNQTFQFELYRTYQDDPDNALAKAKELKLILAEMREQAVARIIRELAQLQ